MKTWKCKRCNHTEQGNSPSCLIKHARDAHGRSNSGRRRAAGSTSRRGKHVAPEVDAETELLRVCTEAFANADTDRAGDQRVLEYLAARFGPAAYDDVDGADEEAPEE